MLTFQDIFKSSFLENIAGVSLLDMALALLLAFCLGMFIFLVYQKTFTGVMYSSSFGVTLVALTMVTTVVILAVTSNVVLSLGMVGALSIVRFCCRWQCWGARALAGPCWRWSTGSPIWTPIL